MESSINSVVSSDYEQAVLTNITNIGGKTNLRFDKSSLKPIETSSPIQNSFNRCQIKKRVGVLKTFKKENDTPEEKKNNKIEFVSN